jgi:hypothetical protein
MKAKRRQISVSTDPPLSRQEYFAERQLLLEARQRSFQRAEQLVVGGSTGALLLSITFLEKLAPNPTVERPLLLVGAWAVLLVGLSASLLGHYTSGQAFGCEIDCLEALVHGEPPPRNRWRRINAWCDYGSAVFLVAGIAMLAVFAFLNAPFRI